MRRSGPGQETGLKSIAQAFGAHPSAIPSDFVPKAEIEKYSRAGLAATRDAGSQHFGVRVHGTTDYPARLRDTDHPVGLLCFQGNWELVKHTVRCRDRDTRAHC